MKKVVDEVSNVGKSRRGGDGVGGDAIAALGQGGDDGENGGTDEGGVVAELRERLGANQNGSEFENGKSLTCSSGDAGLHIEEHNL